MHTTKNFKFTMNPFVLALCHVDRLLVFRITCKESHTQLFIGFKMHSLKFYEVVNHMLSFFYRIGFWHRGDEATIQELVIKSFYCIYHFLFTISLVVGTITSDNWDDSIFFGEIAIIAAVLTVELWILVWRQTQILKLLNQICIFSIRCDDDFSLVNEKLSRFIQFVMVLLIYLFVADCTVGAIPFVTSERTLFFKIGFPLDWRNNEIAFWIANTYVFTGLILSMAAFLLAIIVWYLMLICCLRYTVLGNELRKLGQISQERTIKMENELSKLGRISQERTRRFSEMQKNHFYLHDLMALMDACLELTKYSHLSQIFF